MCNPAFPAAHEALRSGAFVVRSRAALATLRETVARRRQAAQVVLTELEQRILHLIADGQTDKEIAAQLGVRPTTVATHVARASTKLAARNRAHLIALAFRHSLLAQ